METIWSKTSQLIRERGWARNTYEAGKGEKLCLLTGMGFAATKLALDTDLAKQKQLMLAVEVKAAASCSHDHLFVDCMFCIWNWNDDFSRTEEEVHALLRRLHVKEIKGFDIGEPLKEVEFEPIPESAPIIEEPASEPSSEPVKEPQPA